MSAEIKDGLGYVGGKRITDYYSDLGYKPVWSPSNSPVEGGAYGTYSFVKSGGGSSGSSSGSKSNNKSSSKAEKQYYVPGQQSLEDAIARLDYTPRSMGDMQKEAANLANLQIDPQLAALKAAINKAVSDAGIQKTSVEANYANVQPTAARLLEEAQAAGTESAIARGGGRAGAVEYEVGKMKRPINESVMQAEAQKSAQLSAIDQALATIQEKYSDQTQSLEAQRGSLEAAQLAALLAGDREMASNMASQRVGAEYNLASLLNSRDLSNQQNVLAQAEITGQFPGMPEGTVTLRDYLSNSGYDEPGWDPGTGNVTVNGKTYTPEQLSKYGYIQNGRWQLPESIIRSMLQ
jgi:hypothetical protein